MLKSSAYVFLLTLAGAFVVLAAMAIPQVFTADLNEDLRDDLFRAREMALDQYRLKAWDQVVAAQSAARTTVADAVSPKPKPKPEVKAPPTPGRVPFRRGLPAPAPEPEPEPEPAPEPDKAAIQALSAELARELRQDLVVILDKEGKVLGLNEEEGPAAEGDDLSGLPPVKEALQGTSRDGLWVIKPGRTIYTLGASPLVAVREGEGTVVGAVLVGDRLDSSFATQAAERLNPTNHRGYNIGLAFVHNGRAFASSVNDGDLREVVSGLADKVKTYKRLPTTIDKGYIATSEQTTLSGSSEIGTFLTALDASEEGGRIGVVAVAVRPKILTDLRELVPKALALEDSLAFENAWFVGGVAFVLFLIGLLLISSEFSGPGRALERRLREVKQDVEGVELKLPKLHGVYRDVGAEISQIITVLRKRLEHEREARHAAEDAMEGDSGAGPTLFPAPGEPLEPEAFVPPAPVQPTAAPTPVAPVEPAAAPDTVVNPHAMNQAPPQTERPKPSARSSSNWRRPRVPLSAAEPSEATEAPISLGSSSILKPLESENQVPIALNSRLDLQALPDNEPEPERLPSRGVTPEQLPDRDTEDKVEDYTLDMPRDELATLFRTLSSDDDEGTPPSRTETSPYGVDDPSDDVPEKGWTNLGLSALEESFSQSISNSTNTAASAPPPSSSRPAAAAQAGSAASLLETLKQRSAAAPSSRPARARTPSASRPSLIEESTQVKRVNPADLRKSAEHGAMPRAPESGSGIHKLSGIEQQELRELYQTFVETKKSCGEPVEGLTLKRFAKRVIANRRKLIQQYNCRTVRFQVYVKNGKAALKATPLK